MSADQVFELTSPPARRGRPRKEGALTNAQRQAAYKQRLKEKAEQASVSDETIAAWKLYIRDLERESKMLRQLLDSEREASLQVYEELHSKYVALLELAKSKGFA